MSKLKKSLALILSLILVLGAISVAAAFSDVPADYEYVTETQMLNDLGIFNGYPDGTFHPEATITRAEATAVIYRMLSGKTDASNFVGATSFSDVAADNWATGYINYCTELKVVNGYPDGTFQPLKPVTFAEMTTMIVRALGLDTGSLSFPFGYLAVADTNRVTDAVDLLPNAAAPRGAVAKLAYNAIMNATYLRIATEDNKNPTIAEDVLKLKSYEGVITGINGYGEGDTDDNEIKIDGVTPIAKFAKDSSYLGLKVTIWYKGTSDANDVPTKFDKVYAVVPETNTSLTLNMADMSYVAPVSPATVGTIKYDSSNKTVKLDTDYTAYSNMSSMTQEDFMSYIELNAGSRALTNVKFTDTNDNGKYDIAFVTSYNYAQVSRVTSDNIYFTDSTKNIDLKDDDDTLNDVTYPSGLVKDDRVLIYKEDSKIVVTLVPKTTGSLASINNADAEGNGTNLTIGAVDYKMAAIAGKVNSSNLGSTFNYYVEPVFGYIVEATTDSGTANVMYVKDAQAIVDGWGTTTYEAKVVLADDTNETLNFDSQSVFNVTEDDEDAYVSGFDGVGVYTYTLNSDGDLTKITMQDLSTSGAPSKNGSLLKVGATNYSLNNDSIMFFIDSDAKVHAYQGSLPSFSVSDDATAMVSVKTGTSFVTIKYAIVNIGSDGKLTGASETSGVIGFATAIKFVTDGDNYAKKYTIAADGAVSDYMTIAESATSDLDSYKGVSGNFVKFDLDADGRISEIDAATVGEIGSGEDVEVGYVLGQSSETYDIRYSDATAADLADADSVYMDLNDDANVYNIDVNDKKAALGIADDILVSDIDTDNSYTNLYAIYVVVDGDDNTLMNQVFVCTDQGVNTLTVAD